MSEIARIKQIFRYPVKSMAGEDLASAELGWHGLKGDRRYSFVRAGEIADFPWLTASKLPDLVRFKAYHVDGKNSSSPVVHVRTPEGEDLEVESESLRQKLAASYGREVSLMRLGNGIFDDAPISVISTTTLRAVETESGCIMDARRFRPNILIEPIDGNPVYEREWIGKTIVFGNQPTAPSLRVTIQDIRCVMVNLDPETAASDPRVLRAIARSSNNCAGVYGTILSTGVLSAGEKIYIEG